jgi:hypothetical protein
VKVGAEEQGGDGAAPGDAACGSRHAAILARLALAAAPFAEVRRAFADKLLPARDPRAETARTPPVRNADASDGGCMTSMKTRSWRRLCGTLLLLLGLAGPAGAQQTTATLTGLVTDSTGAVHADASVVALNQRTGVSYPSRSNDAGNYVITGLPVGIYVVKAEIQGFKAMTTNPITLEVGQTARVDVKLELGDISETIEVVGVNPVLQTENATVGEVISGTTITAMPLNGRNFAQLALLAPGVQTHSPDTFTNVKQNTDSGRPYVNGQREQANNFMLDGIDQNEAVDNTIAYYPSPDAIGEMRIETNNYSAEFGNVAGGVITMVTKSGSNEFHGEAFEFGRHDALDANSWANNRAGAQKADLRQNIFGGTLGGPIVRNKVFFFADYQGTKISRPGDAVGTVAPADWRNGDFSGLLSQGIVIVDPLTGQPFPGNVVPRSRFSPQARALLGDTTNYPLPNRPGLTGNYVHTANTTTNNHQGDVKIDANLGVQDNVFLRGSFGRYDTSVTEAIYPLAMGAGFLSDAQSGALNWTHTFGPTKVNELRLGFSHVTIDQTPVDPGGVGDYNQTLGIPGGQLIPGLTLLAFGNSTIDNIGNAGVAHNTNNKTYQLSDKLSISTGRHFLSVGGQWIHYNMNQLYASNSGFLGTVNFGGAGFATGFGFSNFLLDDVFAKGVLLNLTGGPQGSWTQLQDRVGLFVQDDFKPIPNLTLNLGLRWEYASPVREQDNRQVNWDVNTGARLVPGQNGVSDATYDPYYGGISPRAGFAWTANAKTVVRGGFGLVQYQEGTGANCRLPINPPFYNEAAQTYTTAAPGHLAQGFQDIGAGAVPPLSQVQLRAWQTDLKPQLTKQWNLFLERQLTATTSLSVGYVGSRSTRVVTFNDINMYVPGTGDPSTWAPLAERRRLPQLGFIRYTASNGVVNYDGLQASMRRRRSNGFEFLASYTFSKALTDNQGFYGPGWGGRAANQGTSGIGGDGNYNAYDLHLDYGPSWFSALHTGALSASYDLPFGKGRKMGGDWSGATQAILGGWNLNTIVTVRSGLPITVTEGFGPGRSLQTSGFVNERPDRVPGVNPVVSNPSWDRWLDPAAFAPQPLGQFGNAAPGIARGAAFYNLDLGIDKSFELGASRLLTLRIEAFNALNHPNKGLPVRNITSPVFGTITETANAARTLEIAAKFAF